MNTLSRRSRKQSRTDLATLYDGGQPGRGTITANLQVPQQCNAVSIGMFIQEVLHKLSRNVSDVCVLYSDSASYMQKLHKHKRKSYTNFRRLHFKNPCHVLNNTLEEGTEDGLFHWCTHDFIVHFPDLVFAGIKIKVKCLLLVHPAGCFSFHEPLIDILNYWRAIVPFRKSDDVTGKKF